MESKQDHRGRQDVTVISSSTPNKEDDWKKEKSKQGFSTKREKTIITSLPPSISSSPGHEFSFTISTTMSSAMNSNDSNLKMTKETFAIDLSPADDIFFHGHLLPLQLLPHPVAPPRSSTTSLDSKKTLDQKSIDSRNVINNNSVTKIPSKQQSLSLFGIHKWKKTNGIIEEEEEEKKKKRKIRFNLRRILKRYVRVVLPLLFLTRGGRAREKRPYRRQTYSYSGNLSLKRREDLKARRGGVSAPASMRTSPVNSGVLMGPHGYTPTSESTMEDLQSAIQAAIAHCKNSIAAKEEQCKC